MERNCQSMSKMKLQGTFREGVPLHFLFKIESFSLLAKNSIVKYESSVFETGGYKWKLSLYPNGNQNENGNGHISLYLVLVDDSSASLPAGWELNVLFRLFLFDQIRDIYMIREDMDERTRRFHEMKKIWGFPQFISLAEFENPGNGFLINDTCVFGAEIFISKPPGNIECLSMVKHVTTVTHTWNMEKFSEIKKECISSEKFKAGDLNWDLFIYPKGYYEGMNNSVSLYLFFKDSEKDPGLKVYTNCKLRVRDQYNGNHIEFSTVNHWFCGTFNSWGSPKLIGLDVLNGQGNGYLVNDTCIVEAQVEVLGVVVSKRP